MLITRRGLIRRLLNENPAVRARCARRYLVSGNRLNWRHLVTADSLADRDRRRIQGDLLDLIDAAAAARIVASVDRYAPPWRTFFAALARRHAATLKPRLEAMLDEKSAARLAIAVVGLGALAPRDAGAARTIRNFLVAGAPIEAQRAVREAVAALGRLDDPEAITLLCQLCRSPEAWRRAAAAQALAAAPSPEGPRALLEASVRDPDLITSAAAAALARRVDVARMIGARNPDLARAALAIFRTLVAGLGETLDLSRLPRLRLVDQARALLERFLERPLAPAVEAVLDFDAALRERWWPAYYARSEGAPSAWTAGLGHALQDLHGLAEGMRPLDKPHVITALIEGLDDEEEDYVRRSVACLGRLGNEAAVEPLLHRLPRSWGDFRHEVIRALGRIGSEAAAEPLIAALRSRLAEARSESAFQHTAEERREIAELLKGLCRLEGGVPTWVFRAAFSHDDEAVRRTAAERLERLAQARDTDAHDLLAAALRRDQSARVRAAAAESLGGGGAEGAEALLGALSDRDEAVRRAAVRSLGRLRALAAAEPLSRLLREPRLRRDAAVALGRISRGNLPPGVIGTLVDAATDRTDPARAIEAVRILGPVDIYEAQIALEHLAKDPAAHPDVRAAAEHARWNRTR